MNHKLKLLLQTLSDGNYHSGTILGKRFKLTGSAIRELIKQLKALGINIEAKTNSGYRIPEGLELLDKKIIQSYTQTYIIDKLAIFDTLPSTNSYLIELIKNSTENPVKESKNSISICLAEQQTAGRGRLGRTWLSPFAQNIYLSLAWQFHTSLYELSGLSLVVAIAIVQALIEYGITIGLSIKWPNDILWEDRKLAGILIDLPCETNHIHNAVIGIGLNLNMPKEIGKKIGQPWCDISQIRGTVPKKNQLTGLLLNKLLDALNLFQNSGLQPFIKKWQKFDATFGQKVELYILKQKFSGIAAGINKQGHFLLKDPCGKIVTFASGEVSFKKIKNSSK